MTSDPAYGYYADLLRREFKKRYDLFAAELRKYSMENLWFSALPQELRPPIPTLPTPCTVAAENQEVR